MTADNNMFDVSEWFRGSVNKKMILPNNESMFGGIDYWISRPVSNENVVIEMSFFYGPSVIGNRRSVIVV